VAVPPAAYTALREKLGQIHDLDRARAVLAWDSRTMMPAGGAEVRAEQLATLEGVRHDLLVSDEIGRLLEELRSYEEGLPADSDEASLVRVSRRDRDKELRVPASLRSAIARAKSLGEHAWKEARARSDFDSFVPYLERNVELKLRYAECFDAEHVYDPLLDDFEPGMKTVEVASLLCDLKEAVAPLAAAIAERAEAVDDSCMHGHFPAADQEGLLVEIARDLPLPPGTWRLDHTAHPFANAFATTDVRITTRYDERRLGTALFAMLHEAGHGLYESGISPSLERTPLCRPVSLGLHESQSRLWENAVGRSRAFWRRFFPKVQSAFPERFAHLDAEDVYRAASAVRPSLIRVEADEVTYDLHVILRFELEQEILQERLKVRDLPDAWNARVMDYLGLAVPRDADGVLQDVHWAEGLFGYFPTYSLGNVIAAQIGKAAHAAMPDLDARLEAGELHSLQDWLQEHVHRHGRKFTPAETVARAVGGPVDVEPYVRYLRAKYGELYGL
jgi:carboxypeptidase Taq